MVTTMGFFSSLVNTRRSSSNNTGSIRSRSTRCETVAIDSPPDVERALASVHRPRRINITAPALLSKDLTKKAGPRLRQLLRRCGCLELSIAGKKPEVPRRVYESELVQTLKSIKKPHKLALLELRNIDVQRLGDAGGSLADCMAKFANLEELHLHSCRWDDNLFPEIVKVVLEVLTKLQKVTLHFCDGPSVEYNDVMLDAATQLLERPAIQSLALSDYPQSPTFWKNVASSTTLQHLSLTCHHDEDLPCLSQLLQENQSLNSLELNLESSNTNVGILAPMAQQLRKNKTIQCISLHLQNHDVSRVANVLTDVLERDNLTLKYVNLLCHNLYGYKVRIPCEKLDFLARLNRQGRHHLWRVSQEQDDWIDAITDNQFDTSAVYYSLRSNPALLVK